MALTFATSAMAKPESYKILSGNPKDKSFIRINKEEVDGKVFFQFERCTESSNCSSIGLKQRYSAEEIRRTMLRAEAGLINSAAAATYTSIAAAVVGTLVGVGLSPAGPGAMAAGFLVPVAGARGIYEACAAPGDGYKRKVLKTGETIKKGAHVCKDLDQLAADIGETLDPREANLAPRDQVNVESTYKTNHNE